LLYVIDGGSHSERQSPVSDFNTLHNELKLYKGGILLEKPALVAMNKCDLVTKSVFNKKLEQVKKLSEYEVVPISAREGTNLELLVEKVKAIM